MKAWLLLFLASCAVDHSKRTPGGAPILLGTPVTATPLAPGSRPDPHRPEGTDLLPEIEHIVVLVMENHSFDNYFGGLGRGDGFDGTQSNVSDSGQVITPYHLPSTSQEDFDISPGWHASHVAFDGGKNDGFLVGRKDTYPLGYFDEDDIPYYYAIARTFPLADRWFSSLLGPTYPNRRFLSAATARGIVTTELPVLNDGPPPNGTIYDTLSAHGIVWTNYTAFVAELALFPSVAVKYTNHVKLMADFFADAAAGTLPSYALITPSPGNSEEDPQDIRGGAAFARTVIEAVLRSPAWTKTLMVFIYDEGGGYYDHVPPPAAFAPDDVPPDPTQTGGILGGYDQLGFRVPAVIMSPYARRDYVSHVVHDHTSILRLIETKWNLGALTFRDANASNLLDALDFWSKPAFAVAPEF